MRLNSIRFHFTYKERKSEIFAKKKHYRGQYAFCIPHEIQEMSILVHGFGAVKARSLDESHAEKVAKERERNTPNKTKENLFSGQITGLKWSE